jgi:hypothetical protein
MINYITILLALLLGFGISFVFAYIKTDGFHFARMITLILVCVMLLFTPIYVLGTFNEAVTLPFKYDEAHNNVIMTADLLSRLNNVEPNNTTVGYALQELGNKLRTQHKQQIEEENYLRRKIDSWINNPLMPYSNVIIERLPDYY